MPSKLVKRTTVTEEFVDEDTLGDLDGVDEEELGEDKEDGDEGEGPGPDDGDEDEDEADEPAKAAPKRKGRSSKC